MKKVFGPRRAKGIGRRNRKRRLRNSRGNWKLFRSRMSTKRYIFGWG